MTIQDDISARKVREFERAFLNAIQDIKDQARLSQLERLIAQNDVDGVIRLLGLDDSAFSDVKDELRASLAEGGKFTAQSISPIPVQGVGNIPYRFDLALPAAIQWLEQRSSTLITEITEGQREMVRDAITQRTANGVNPRTTALDLVGRVDIRTGKRAGGIIGLTSQQNEWIDNAAGELEGLDNNYLTRKLRDRRFDSAFVKARRDGKPLPEKTKRAMIENMRNRALRFRSENIARTEAINALRAGQHIGLAQAIEKGDLQPQDVTKEWDATNDTRTRPAHLQLEGERKPLGELFTTSKGSQLEYPGDVTHGALPEDVINCRCVIIYRVDYLAMAIRGFS